MKIISIGELMVEMINTNDDIYKKTYSGDTFNVACYMRHYAPEDWHIDYGTTLGQGTDDNRALDFMGSYGIGTAGVTRHDNRTIGLYTLSNDASGEKQYGYWRSQSAAKTYFDRVHDFSKYDMVYFSGITSAVTENRDNLVASLATTKRHNQDTIITYDFQHRRQLWSPEEGRALAEKIMPYCDILKISDEELPWVFDEDMTLATLSNMAPNAEIIFTKGGDGSERWQGGEKTHSCPAVPVDKILDTSAAGDSFIACYLWQRGIGADVMTALQCASKLASAVLGYKGSIVPPNQLPKL